MLLRAVRGMRPPLNALLIMSSRRPSDEPHTFASTLEARGGGPNGGYGLADPHAVPPWEWRKL